MSPENIIRFHGLMAVEYAKGMGVDAPDEDVQHIVFHGAAARTVRRLADFRGEVEKIIKEAELDGEGAKLEASRAALRRILRLLG